MKKNILLFSLLCLPLGLLAQIYMGKTCEISFFSKAPLEDIEAKNIKAVPVLNSETGDIQIKVAIQDFIFPKPLMQEHFNENYMESEKYPDAIFKGKVHGNIDYKKDGEYKTTVIGKLMIHGVEKERLFEGTVTVKGTQLLLKTTFPVHVADHEIKVPTLYVQNIAEDVAVTMNAMLEPYKVQK